MYKVYIVDDAVLVRKELVFTTPWEQLNCMVVGQAEDGRQALEEILKLEPDIVITDIKLPYMSGLELIRELKEQNCHSEFIVISGFSEFEYAFSAIKLEVQDYILKPISDEELLKTLEKTIERIKYGKQYTAGENLIKEYDIENLNQYLRKAVFYIKEHYKEEISLKDIAGELMISESYLVKLFKVEMRTTFVEYMTKIRIGNSLKLLKKSSMPIYQVAEEVGFKDYRYFSMVFKKVTKLTPKEFQQKS